MCNCREVASCTWASWGSWSNLPSNFGCITRTRRRSTVKTWKHVMRRDRCDPYYTKCRPEYVDEQERMCKCKKVASCTTTQWTSWSPNPKQGECVKQQRTMDMVDKYTHVFQKDNCHGLQTACAFKRKTDTQTYCNCPYKECNLGVWSSWKHNRYDSNKCPFERREQAYIPTTKYKYAYGTCNGVGRQSCPPPKNEDRAKAVQCPKLSAPKHGFNQDASCDSSKCMSVCRFQCDKGYKPVGSRVFTCQGSGNWDKQQGSCKDVEQPSITCPYRRQELFNVPTKDFAVVVAPTTKVTMSDNSGETPTLTNNKNASTFNVYVNKPQILTYTATDVTGNEKSCDIQYIALDNEPAKMLACPKDFLVEAGRTPKKVFWTPEPNFYDNVDKTNVRISSDLVQGSDFYRGRTKITYLARDQSLNVANCTFTVTVELKSCKSYPAPKNGALLCNLRKDGKAETYVCGASCKKGFWFSEKLTRHYTYYVCSEDAEWQGQDKFDPFSNDNTFFDILEKGKSPWPNCSPSNTPEDLNLDFKVFGDSCLDSAQQETLKRQFVSAMKADMMINAMFCSKPDARCDARDIVVQCDARTKRALFYAQSKAVTTFSLKLKNDMQNATQNLAALKNVERIVKTEVKKVVPGNFSVKVEAEIVCLPGYELLQVANKTLNKCVQCPAGSFFDSTAKSCKACATDHYQQKAGQQKCIRCPTNSIANGTLPRDHVTCQAVCVPGQFSTNGLAPCTPCPLSTYQPNSESTSCLKCPAKNVTTQTASTSFADCKHASMDVYIVSEGCYDLNKRCNCGWGTIHVDGKQRSLKRRGMNFVVLNATTGEFIHAASFDWHADTKACGKTEIWFHTIKNGVMILAASQDEASARMTQQCVRVLKNIGARQPLFISYRSSFAMVGYKGHRNVTWIRQIYSDPGKGPTKLHTIIPLMNQHST